MLPLPPNETVGLLGLGAGGRGHVGGGGAGGLGEAVHLGVLPGQLQALNVQTVFGYPLIETLVICMYVYSVRKTITYIHVYIAIICILSV